MRLFLCLILISLSSITYSDTYQVVTDLNYEVESSNSQVDRGHYSKTLSLGKEVFFIALVDGGRIENSFHNLKHRKLAVTDGTIDGTSIVSGFEGIDFTGRFHSMHIVGGKLIVLIRGEDQFVSEVWEVSPKSKEATKIHELSLRLAEFGFVYSYGDNKLVISDLDKRSLVVFDSTTSTIKQFSLSEISNSGAHLVGLNSFVLGDYLYYEYRTTAGKYQIYKLDLVNEEIEHFADSRIGESHKQVGEHVYFIKKDNNNEYGIYSLSASSNTIDKEYGPINFSAHPYSQFYAIDDFVVYFSFNDLIVKNISGGQFTKLSLPEDVQLKESYSKLASKFVFFDEKYYLLTSGFLLETDLATYVTKVSQKANNSVEGTLSWKFINAMDGELFLIADTEVDYYDSEGSYGKTFVMQWTDGFEALDTVWEKENFSRVMPIDLNRKEIIFAYTVEQGVEPWFFDFRNQVAVPLGDLNTDFRTRDNTTLFIKSIATRALFHFPRFHFLPPFDYMSFNGVEVSNYTNPNSTGEYDEFIGMGKKYDYYLAKIDAVNYHRRIIHGFNSDSGRVEELSDFTISAGIRNGTFSQGIIPFLTKVCKGDCNNFTSMLEWSVGGVHRYEIDSIFDDVFSTEHFQIITGWDDKKLEQVYGIVKGGKIIKQFSIPCDRKFNCQGAFNQFMSTPNSLIIATDTVFYGTDDYQKLYYVNIVDETQPKKINLSMIGVDRIPQPTPVMAFNDLAMLYWKKEFGSIDNGKMIRYEFSNDTTIEYPLQINGGKIHEVGKYHVVDAKEKLVVFDNELRIVKEKVKNSIAEELGYDPDAVHFGNLWDCLNGVCYIQAEYSKPASNKKGLFQIKFDRTLDNFIAEHHDIDINRSIWSLKNRSFVVGETSAYGVELYQYKNIDADSDGDGITDSYELAYDLNPDDSSDGSLDLDKDGLSNKTEFELGTNPLKVNSDSDELSDGEEVAIGLNLDPTVYDTHLIDRDSDGLSYRLELIKGTNPLSADTDEDGFEDSIDVFPLDSTEALDSDNDGLGNNSDQDDDNDGMPDEWEERYGLDPLSAEDRDLDPDNDGKTNYQEYQAGTDPRVSNKDNSDNDGGGSGGGGSAPMWLLFLLLTLSARRYYK